MTNQQYISIAKLLEQTNPELFEQLKTELCQVIDVELLFIHFCVVQKLKPSEVIQRPYNREASRLKSLFIGMLLVTIQKDNLPRGYKKDLADVLEVPKQKIGYLVQNVTLFLNIYPEFIKEVNEICAKIKKHERSTNFDKQIKPVLREPSQN